MDRHNPPTHSQIRIRHPNSPRRFVVRRPLPAVVGQFRPAYRAVGQPAAVDGDAGQPRGRDHPTRPPPRIHRLQRTVANAVR